MDSQAGSERWTIKATRDLEGRIEVDRPMRGDRRDRRAGRVPKRRGVESDGVGDRDRDLTWSRLARCVKVLIPTRPRGESFLGSPIGGS